MGKDLVDLTFYKGSSDEPWGFRLAGGKDYGQPLTISQVSSNSLAANVGLKEKDFLNSIAGQEVFNMTHDEAEKAIMQAGNRFNMVIEREVEGGRKISFENSATTFALKLKGSGGGIEKVEKKEEAFISNVAISEDTPMLVDGSVNFKKYEKKAADITASKTLEKPHQRKDWNCPWVKKDGSGLKQAIRYVDQPLTSAKTSRQHFYSEPRSILAAEKELTREELEALIAEHGQESRPESRLSQGSRPASRVESKQVETRYQQQQVESETSLVQQQVQTVQSVQNSYEEHQRVSFANETYSREREEDSQAPPDLEPVEVQQQNFSDMAQFGDGAYEPSADELIDVLKNLENLAALNPGLYRTIVEQIKGSSTTYYEEVNTTQQNGSTEQQYQEQMQYEQQMQYQQEEQLFQQQLEQQQMEFEQHQQEQMQYEQHSSMTEQVIVEESTMSEESALLLQQQQLQLQQQQKQEKLEKELQAAKMSMSEEEFKQHQKMKRLEAEAQEEVRIALTKQREAKMKALRAAEPQKPKEITVIAGDGKQVKIQLGGDQIEDSRKQVAEAAGLKHVPLADFDDTDSSAWAGSLKKTAKTKIQSGRGEEEMEENPWAGSLRHVKGPSKNKKHEDRDDDKGSAPWMGTLRHVVHDNKVTRNYGVNQHQSKRYPDEDAGNPYESLGGSNSKPAFPLTPAAIINGSVMSRDDMARMEEEEEVARIRSNIGSKTVSTALLQVLMPKLLKMHETKYEPMEKADAEQIMEEILGMQCGLNPDQQADANEEAEMIIRAIMQDEVDKSVYIKMADDLESAAKRLKKRKVKKVKETQSEIAA